MEDLKSNIVNIERLMTKHPIILKPDDSISKAEMLFKKFNIRHLPVVEKNQMMGILSITDIMRISFGDDIINSESSYVSTFNQLLSVKDIMKKNPNFVYTKSTLNDVSKLLIEEDFHALPVLEEEENSLVGIITTTDIIRYLLNYYNEHCDLV